MAATDHDRAGRITTHVLDTVLSEPARGMEVALFRIAGGMEELVNSASTNADGRVESPLLEGESFIEGIYEIRFNVGEYMMKQGGYSSQHGIWGLIPVRFKVADSSKHYHVPLLVSPGGYSAYRGS